MVGIGALVLSLLAAAVALVSAKSWTARRWTFPGVVVAATVMAGAFGQVAIWAGGAAGVRSTNLPLTGVRGLAQTSVLVATALLGHRDLTLVMVCLGISIHTGTWSSTARIVRTVPPRSDRTSA